MTLLQHARGGHGCYCTLETPESQIICALDKMGKGRAFSSWPHAYRKETTYWIWTEVGMSSLKFPFVCFISGG